MEIGYVLCSCWWGLKVLPPSVVDRGGFAVIERGLQGSMETAGHGDVRTAHEIGTGCLLIVPCSTSPGNSWRTSPASCARNAAPVAHAVEHVH